MQIESLEEWLEYAELINKLGFTVFQMQYDIDAPEGFIVKYWLEGAPIFEVVTHSAEVYRAITNQIPKSD